MSVLTGRQDIDFSQFPSSDGEPMADTEDNLVQMIDLIFTLRQALEPRGHHVGGNLLIYWDPADGWQHVSPDVFVALDAGTGRRASWRTWEEGKFPEVVFEVASPSTRDRDVGAKLDLYARLGAREYYIIDLAGALVPAFRGYARREGRLIPLANPTGSGISSPLLGLELRVVDGWLRVVDPASGQPYLVADEERQARLDEERARRQAEERAAQAEERAAQAEERAAQAEEARLTEERARRQAEEVLRAALAQLARPEGRAAPAPDEGERT